MSLRTPNLAVEIAVANLDLYPYSLPGQPNWGSNLEQMVPFLEATGCYNYEIHPTRAIVNQVETRAKDGDTELAEATIGSLHQTFNTGEGLFGKIATERGVYYEDDSVQAMQRIQRAIGRPLASVHLPKQNDTDDISHIPSEHSESDPEYPGSFPVVQPAAALYNRLRVRSNGALTRKLSRYGIVGLCPDTVHARLTHDGTTPPPIEGVWAHQFRSGQVYETHVSAGRTDLAKRDPSVAALSGKELKAFTSRNWRDAYNTEMGAMIVAGIENWVSPAPLAKAAARPVLRQVIEIPPHPQAFLRRTREHGRFVANLVEIIREAGATPITWGSPNPRHN